jgi:ABC-type transport system involved in cytochrome bd biosynthesis fused ATPase/permease subunit
LNSTSKGLGALAVRLEPVTVGGAGVSGLTRALLIDSTVGILDGTTVGRDAHDERSSHTPLTRLMEGRTAIMTSHQLSLTAPATPVSRAPIPSLPAGAAR